VACVRRSSADKLTILRTADKIFSRICPNQILLAFGISEKHTRLDRDNRLDIRSAYNRWDIEIMHLCEFLRPTR
jgi:hypothetical protein